MNKLLSIEKLYYDSGLNETESEEAEKVRSEFYKVCLTPLLKSNREKGYEAESLYGHSISCQHIDGLEKHADRQLAPKTALRYKQLLILWIIPALGHIRLNKLKPPQILDFYANLEEDGIRKDGKPGCLSDRTRLHIHRLLHTVLQAAVQWEYLAANPAISETG